MAVFGVWMGTYGARSLVCTDATAFLQVGEKYRETTRAISSSVKPRCDGILLETRALLGGGTRWIWRQVWI